MKAKINQDNFRHGVFRLELFDGEYAEGKKPFKTMGFENAYVDTGGALLLDLLIGGAGTVFNNANAHIGVGDSSSAVAAGQTDLLASSNKTRKAMDSTFPSRTGQVMTFKSTFGTDDANYAWNEMAIFNASSAGTMLCRSLVSSPFTKTSGISVVATYTLTVP